MADPTRRLIHSGPYGDSLVITNDHEDVQMAPMKTAEPSGISKPKISLQQVGVHVLQ